MLRRAMFIPAPAIRLITCVEWLAGPIVQMIFVWRKSRRAVIVAASEHCANRPRTPAASAWGDGQASLPERRREAGGRAEAHRGHADAACRSTVLLAIVDEKALLGGSLQGTCCAQIRLRIGLAHGGAA